jgi:hypothetical protein
MSEKGRGDMGAAGLFLVVILFLTLIFPVFWKKVEGRLSKLSFQLTKVLLLPFQFVPEVREYLKIDIKTLGEIKNPKLYWDFLGFYYRLVFLPLEILLILIVLKRDPSIRYRRILSMWSLLEENVKEFPCLMPIIKSGPITEKPSGYGEWAYAMSPIQFALSHRAVFYDRFNPIHAEDVLDIETGLTLHGADDYWSGNFLEVGRISHAFVKQMGNRFDGNLRDLIYHRKALALAFMSHYNDDKVLAFKIFDELSLSWDPDTKKVYVPNLEEMVESYVDFTHPELEIHRSYENVWFMALLRLARKKGSLPSSLWIWLKPTDRALFYVLNQVGGRAAWSEGAAAWSHFVAETKASRPIKDAVIASAVKSLQEALYFENWLDEEKRAKNFYNESFEPTNHGDFKNDPYVKERESWQDPKINLRSLEFPRLPRKFGQMIKDQTPPIPYAIRKEMDRERERERKRLKKANKEEGSKDKFSEVDLKKNDDISPGGDDKNSDNLANKTNNDSSSPEDLSSQEAPSTMAEEIHRDIDYKKAWDELDRGPSTGFDYLEYPEGEEDDDNGFFEEEGKMWGEDDIDDENGPKPS